MTCAVGGGHQDAPGGCVVAPPGEIAKGAVRPEGIVRVVGALLGYARGHDQGYARKACAQLVPSDCGVCCHRHGFRRRGRVRAPTGLNEFSERIRNWRGTVFVALRGLLFPHVTSVPPSMGECPSESTCMPTPPAPMGRIAPSELIREAVAAGVDVLGLSDHDTTSGWAEAGEAVAGTGMTVIPAIELSCQVLDRGSGVPPRSVHLLGYLPDPQHAGLKEQTAKIRSHRDHRLQLMVEKLSVDFDITWEEVAAHIPEGATAGRPHIAHILIEKGFFLDTTEAFAGPLRADGPYHVPHYAPRLAEGIRVLRDAGAVPILAHPYTGAPLGCGGSSAGARGDSRGLSHPRGSGTGRG